MNNTVVIIVALILLAINAIFIIYLVLQNRKKAGDGVDAKDSGLQLLLQQINNLATTVDGKMTDMAKTVDTKLGSSAKEMQESLRHQTGESFRLIKDVTERLTKLDETNRQVVSFTDQLQSLQDILKNPKQRGILGEYYLETLLKNILAPGSFEMQYRLGKNEDGEDLIPDAVVFVKEKIIPIDSKFSLENYNKLVEATDPLEKERLEKQFVNDLKNRIVETSKYIQPSKGTMDFAFMFIPHEAIYYDLLTNKVGALKGEETENLIQRAASKYKVIIVSPTSFLAYLQTVMQALRALKIEEEAKDIIKRVGELRTHLEKHDQYMGDLGRSLGTTVNKYNVAHKELKKIDKDVIKISGVSANIVPIELEKPNIDGEE